MLKNELDIKKHKGLIYIMGEGNKPIRYKPWLGDLFSLFYDHVMKNSIFPKKFNGSLSTHLKILIAAFSGIHNKAILDIAAGSGISSHFLERDNHITGIDISPGLLKKAVKKFKNQGFAAADFYVADALDMPFQNKSFDMAICNLSLNFFTDTEGFIGELKRILKPQGSFFCVVPVPERTISKSNIRGVLHTEEKLQYLFEKHGFEFEPLPVKNGALLYCKAIRKN